ncbi:Zinc finger protein plagl2 [Clonorchis sinensis]|uniref:Zinc finger protein plagl2 n=1 Tax=Clonorchis sinensis TaxID=79923 RepID=A0A3R7DDH7_CLOSI|nr:Zinc finger protein plagl2 [Clonorchis sinensis]
MCSTSSIQQTRQRYIQICSQQFLCHLILLNVHTDNASLYPHVTDLKMENRVPPYHDNEKSRGIADSVMHASPDVTMSEDELFSRSSVKDDSALPSEALSGKTTQNPYKCKVCDKSFQFKSKLERHRAIHDIIKRYHCKLCDAKFNDPSAMRRHQKLQHSDEETMRNFRKHVCPSCGKRFLYATDISNHLVVHTNEKHFVCEVCGATFTVLSTLMRHKRAFHEEPSTEKLANNFEAMAKETGQ